MTGVAVLLIMLTFMQACVAAIILRRPWMKFFALGVAGIQLISAAAAILAIRGIL